MSRLDNEKGGYSELLDRQQKVMAQKADLESNLTDTQERLAQEEEARNALFQNKKKLEQEINGLKKDIEDVDLTVQKSEQRRHAEAQKNLRKSERRIKELTFQAEEDRKNHERMQDLVDKLQQKIKTYKRQIEEAEEIAALNLAKFRKAQQELEESCERADACENAVTKMRAKARGGSAGRFSPPPPRRPQRME